MLLQWPRLNCHGIHIFIMGLRPTGLFQYFIIASFYNHRQRLLMTNYLHSWSCPKSWYSLNGNVLLKKFKSLLYEKTSIIRLTNIEILYVNNETCWLTYWLIQWIIIYVFWIDSHHTSTYGHDIFWTLH